MDSLCYFYITDNFNNKKLNYMLTDDSIITFGTHKGKTLEEVPPSWLFWFHNQVEDKINKGLGISQQEQDIHEYVVDNLQVLQKQLKESIKK